MLTTLGIAGTFFGVFLGLLDFDIGDVNKSVEKLIPGLRLAFSTSVLGISLALVFQVTNVGWRSFKLSQGTETTFEQELLSAIQSLEKTTKNLAKGFADSFAEKLIEELREVVQSINEKIVNELGDSFVELRKAVESLTQWQLENKDHMIELKSSLENSIESIENCQNSLEKIEASAVGITQQAEAIVEISEGLKTTYEQLDNQQRRLLEIWPKFETMRDSLENAFSSINEEIEKLDGGLTKVSSNLKKHTEDIGSSISKEIQSVQEEMFGNLVSVTKKIADDYSDFLGILEKFKQAALKEGKL